MSIRLHLENLAFGPEEIGQMQEAYEKTLHELGLVDRTDPLTEIVAKKIIEIIQNGERVAASSGFIVSDRPRLREALQRKAKRAQAQQSPS